MATLGWGASGEIYQNPPCLPGSFPALIEWHTATAPQALQANPTQTNTTRYAASKTWVL